MVVIASGRCSPSGVPFAVERTVAPTRIASRSEFMIMVSMRLRV
jgi:hypothetical protein